MRDLGKWKVPSAVAFGFLLGLTAGWIACDYATVDIEKAQSVVATGKAVEAFEACDVDRAITYAAQGVGFDPTSSMAQGLLTEFIDKRAARLSQCADKRAGTK
jgi:small ligand-binding sensory domain FIST